MPLYEYQCKQCHHRLEKIQSFSAPPETVCPKCGGPLEKLISAPAIQFKGEGWYVNDYARSGKKAAPSAEAESASDGKSESSKDSSNISTTALDPSSSSSGSNSSGSGPVPAASSSANSGKSE